MHITLEVAGGTGIAESWQPGGTGDALTGVVFTPAGKPWFGPRTVGEAFLKGDSMATGAQGTQRERSFM